MPDFTWENITSIEYWLEGLVGQYSVAPTIDTSSPSYLFFPIFFTVIFILGVALKVSQSFLHPLHPIQPRFSFWSNNFIWNSVIGINWFVFMQISVGFLGARFWLIALLLWLLTILFFAFRYLILNFRLENSYFQKNKVPIPGVFKDLDD